uniref:EamA domain-containing protein n=1 Tax=Trypanosoma vivax (strain Y486) TaxID=1055687 RepID=G0U082_TRYVY|nr:conserved hypothetical protein [Trypanosoma vivax Y486]
MTYNTKYEVQQEGNEKVVSNTAGNDASQDEAEQKKGCCKRYAPPKYILGVFLIICVAFIWTYASVLIQYIFQEMKYGKPYFMTYFNTNAFAVNTFGFLFVKSWRRLPWKNDKEDAPIYLIDPALQKLYNAKGMGPDDIDEENKTRSAGGEHNVGIKPYSKFKVFKCACFFCPIWFAANYLFNMSLSLTSVSSVTVLSSTSCVWTFIIALCLFDQRVSVVSVTAVGLTVAGSAMIAYSDLSKGDNHGITGDILSITSAMLYAIYTSVIKWHAPDDDRYSVIMMFGMVGAINLLTFWLGLVILHFSEAETFEFPNWVQFLLLFTNALVGTNLSDILWARAVLLTSPVVATVGLVLTTPISMVSDLLIKKAVFNTLYIFGALFLAIGFITINLESKLPSLSCRRQTSR